MGELNLEKTQSTQKGRLIGKVLVPRGEISVYSKGLEFNTDISMPLNGKECQPFNGFMPTKSWFEIYEVGMCLLYNVYRNPDFISKFLGLNREITEKMTDLHDNEIREQIVSDLRNYFGDDVENVVKGYDSLRRLRIISPSGSRTMEFYNSKREDFVAYILLTDSEANMRSRFILNDVNLNLFLFFVRLNMTGVVNITDTSGENIYVMRERESSYSLKDVKEKYIYKIGNSKGESFTLNVADRINLSYCLKKYFTTLKVRQIRTEKYRL
ncbi:hypothetical protein, partial [Persephonella sp.]